MIKAFLFDYGGVISDGGHGSDLTDRLGEVLGVSSRQAYEYFDTMWNMFFRGQISEEEIWDKLEHLSGTRVPISKRNVWNTWDHMQMRPKMVDLIHQLKDAGYRIGLLSNVIPPTEREIREHGGYELFDFTVLSCNVGYAKPQPEIYELAMNQLSNISPSEVVIVDDQERMLIPAKKLGMQVVHAQSGDQIISDVNRLI